MCYVYEGALVSTDMHAGAWAGRPRMHRPHMLTRVPAAIGHVEQRDRTSRHVQQSGPNLDRTARAVPAQTVA